MEGSPRRPAARRRTTRSRASPAEPLPLGALRGLEQCALLAQCGHVQATRPVHESRVEEVEPYVRACLALPRNWAVATHALRLKARLESSSS